MSDAQLLFDIGPITKKDLVPRAIFRKKYKITNRVAHWIPFNQILIRGKNKRKVYNDIPELAASQRTHGLQEPFKLDVLKSGCFINEGHRRHAAFLLNIELGHFKPTDRVEFFPTHRDLTERDRMIGQYVSNNLQKPYTPIELAEVVFELKHDGDKKVSNAKIAEELALSRQYIDKLMLFAEQDNRFKKEILDGKMTFNDAVDFIRENVKAKKQAEKAELQSHITPRKVSPAQDPLKQDMQDLKELENTPGPDITADDITDDIDTTAEVEQTIEPGQTYIVGASPIPSFNGHKVSEVTIKPVEKTDAKEGKDRIEMDWCNKIIGNVDKLSVIAAKVVPEQTSKDLVQLCEWIQYDMDQLRAWVKSHKQENKKAY